jgi:hypothetical protein
MLLRCEAYAAREERRNDSNSRMRESGPQCGVGDSMLNQDL